MDPNIRIHKSPTDSDPEFWRKNPEVPTAPYWKQLLHVEYKDISKQIDARTVCT